MANQNSSVLTTFIFGIVLIISSWMLYTNLSAPMVEESRMSETWPTTSGIVTYSDIEQSMSDGKTMYASKINYNFKVDNKTFTGDRISLTSNGTSTSSLSEVKKDLKAYPIDAKVTVYYDPELPNNAVLEPGPDFFLYVVQYAPFLLGLLGVLMLWQIVKKVALLIIALLIGRRK